MATKTIKLCDITGDDNRKYTKDDGFKQLVSSIRQVGIIEPPAVRELRAIDGGGYKIIAGRRRVAALRELDEPETECTVYAEDDPRSDEEIALAENVNRLEMHPLDEAALFCRMADKGISVEEIAKHYARSPSAIYKRLRLVSLTEELKGMFRDGRLNIVGAAMLAELPEEDQQEFFNLHNAKIDEKKDDDDEEKIKEIEVFRIGQYIQKKQNNTIEDSMKEACANCAKRTHNVDNALFTDAEDDYYKDVCLDGECYRVKWNNMISDGIEKVTVQMKDAGLETDDKIYFAGGTPESLYKNASKIKFKNFNPDTEYEILRLKNYVFTGETNRKKNACWRVHTDYTGEIDVRRIGYEEKRKEKPEDKAAKGEKKSVDNIKEYGREALEAVAKELQLPSAKEVMKALKEKKIESYDFNNKIETLVYERVVEWRIEKDQELHNKNRQPPEYLELLLKVLENDFSGDRSFDEKKFDDFQKRCLKALFNGYIIKEISKSMGKHAQDFFHFLLVTIFPDSRVPDLDDLKELGKKNVESRCWYLFWKYAGMSVEEYTEVYLQAAKDVAAEALKPKEKKGAKKSAVVKKKAAAVPDPDDEDEDNYPFEPDIEDDVGSNDD